MNNSNLQARVEEIEEAYIDMPKLMTKSLKLRNGWLLLSTILLMLLVISSGLGLINFDEKIVGGKAVVLGLSISFILIFLLTFIAYFSLFRPWAIRVDQRLSTVPQAAH